MKSMDQEAAGGVTVHYRNWTGRRGQNRVREIVNSERGEGPGHLMWVETASGCHSDDVPGLLQRAGRSKTRRHAELVDTRSLQVKEVRHEEGGYERERRRLDDGTTSGTKDRAACENHGLRRTIFEARRIILYEIGGRFDGCEGEGSGLGRCHSEMRHSCSRLLHGETGGLKATCRMKFDRGAFAVGYGVVSDKDSWRV